MISYYIEYMLKGKRFSKYIVAKNLASAKKKIGKKHGYKTGRMIEIEKAHIIGYF